jgi:integrase
VATELWHFNAPREVAAELRALHVRASKTDAGLRDVRLLPVLRDELAEHKAASRASGPDDLVFTTAQGAARDKDNARERVFRPVARRADELLAERVQPPLPEGLTLHKLRHTFASLAYASGDTPPEVMAQLGHADPGFTLRVYAHAMRRDERAAERLRAH